VLRLRVVACPLVHQLISIISTSLQPEPPQPKTADTPATSPTELAHRLRFAAVDHGLYLQMDTTPCSALTALDLWAI
jgi:hypothetical protein